MTPDFYYLETDGQVFLVRRGGLWRFPTKRSQLPCAFTPLVTIPIAGRFVLYAKPHVDTHPTHWHYKDDLIGRSDVDALVQRAVNRTLPRGAAKVAVIEKDHVLMVKASRGITKGYWNLPGGFIGYGEHPEEAVMREAEEELGARIRLTRLLGIYRELFKQTGGYMISFVYQGTLLTRRLRPQADEIAEVAWIPIKEALRDTKNPFARAGLLDYMKTTRKR